MIGHILAITRRWVNSITGLGLIKRVDDAKGLQRCQVEVLAGELLNGVERIQEWGFTSHPVGNAEAVLLFTGADRDDGVIIATDSSQYRVPLERGEVCVYNRKARILLKADGTVDINNGNLTVSL